MTKHEVKHEFPIAGESAHTTDHGAITEHTEPRANERPSEDLGSKKCTRVIKQSTSFGDYVLRYQGRCQNVFSLSIMRYCLLCSLVLCFRS